MLLFIYGTLKRGEYNHNYLMSPENGSAKFLYNGQTVESFPLILGTKYAIPFLLDKAGIGHKIEGEIYEIDDRMLRSLDRLEEYPEIYTRRLELISPQQKQQEDNNNQNPLLNPFHAWIYLFHNYKNQLLLNNEQHFLQSYSYKIHGTNVQLPRSLGADEKMEIVQELRN